MMFHIQNTIVSLDVLEQCFCCDLDACKGACCIEGDAGAPLTADEEKAINDCLKDILPLLTKQAQQHIVENGIAYNDPTGERVTQILNGKDCVFSRTDNEGWCYCAIEKAQKEGKIAVKKPVSCALYPIRLSEHPTFTAVEYHRWDICHSARKCGKKLHLPLYKFLKEPLIRRFGQEWYDELCLTAEEWHKQQNQ